MTQLFGSKPIWASKTVIGAVAVIAATALNVLGIEIGPGEMGEIVNEVIIIGGALLSIYGRFKATKKIG